MTASERREAVIEASVISCDDFRFPSEVEAAGLTPSHPYARARANRIFMAHPYLRELMNCPERPPRLPYCPRA